MYKYINNKSPKHKRKKSIVDKYKGLSFADAAKKIEEKYPQRDYNNIQYNAYKAELEQLQKRQEALKIVEAKKQMSQLPQQAPMQTPMQTDQMSVNPMQEEQQFLGGGFLIDPLPQANPAPLDLSKNFDRLRNLPRSFPRSQQTGLQKFMSGVKKFGANAQDYLQNNTEAPAMVGKALNLGVNAALLAGGPDSEAPNYNPNEQQVRRLMENRKINNEAVENKILEQANATRANINDSARSLNVQRGLQTNLDLGVGRARSESRLQQDQINNQYDAQLAQTLNNLGQQRVQTETYTDDINARNKAVFQNEVSRFGQDVGNVGMTLTQARTIRAQNKMFTDILNGKYTDFGISEDMVDRYRKGQLTDAEIIQLKAVPDPSVQVAIQSYEEQRKQSNNQSNTQ